MRSQKIGPVTPLASGASNPGITSAAAISAGFAQQVAAHDQSRETRAVTDQRTSINLFPETILQTSQSIDAIPEQVIQEQGLSNLQDALKNVPAVTLNAGDGGSHDDSVNRRGLTVSDDFFLDGLHDMGSRTRDPFDYEPVEVLKGPSSTLSGRSTTGGVINQVTKSPQLSLIENIALTGSTNAEIRGTADVNYVLDDTSAIGMNIMGQRNNFDGQPFARDPRWGFAPEFAYTGMPFLFCAPAPVPKDAFYGLASDDCEKTDVEVVTGTVVHKINNVFSISDAARNYTNSYFTSPMESHVVAGTSRTFLLSANYFFE